MHSEIVRFKSPLNREQIGDLYERTIAAEKRRNYRSFSYSSEGGCFYDCDCAPSADQMRPRLAKIPGAVRYCTMESSLGWLGSGETTSIDLHNNQISSVIKILGPEEGVSHIRSVLTDLIGDGGQCTYNHNYKREHDARLEARFSGYVPAGQWPGRVQMMDALTEELTAVRMLKDHIPDFAQGWPNMRMLDSNYISLRFGEGELSAIVGASFYPPNQALGMGSFGVSAEFIYRGTEESVEQAFRTSIQRIGFPRDVAVPMAGRIPFLQDNGFVNKFLSNTTNVKGWRAAVRAVAAEGAELGKHNYSICRFPYNLFIRESDGKISKDGQVLDPTWGEDPIASALTHGRIGSVSHLDNDTSPDDIKKILLEDKEEK